MEDGRALGARQGVQTMLFYYLSSLVGTTKDPKQYIAGELAKMIDLSEDQLAYVRMSLATENKVLDSLSSSIDLLSLMEKSGKLDLDSVAIIKSVLLNLQTECKKALDQYIEDQEDE